jgi:putative ABC transport system permease protein
MNVRHNPPRQARWLLRVLLRGEEREALLGDLTEDYAVVVRERGPHAARRWFWRQTLGALRSRAASSPADTERAGAPFPRKGANRMETLWQDLRYGLRSLAGTPGFTAVTALILALGIGGNTAIFSVVHAVLLRPYPFDQPERIVMLWQHNTKDGVEREDLAPANFVDWRDQSASFEHMAAIKPWSLDYTGGTEPETIRSAQVTRGFFDVLGVRPRLGRAFLPEEHEPGRSHVVVLTHGLWQRKFAGNPNIVGQVLSLDSQSYTVIGVLPSDFALHITREGSRNRRQEMYTPQVVAGEEWQSRVATYLEVVARLKPGVTVAQARAEMSTLAARLAAQYPRENAGIGATVVPLHEQATWAVRPGLLLMLGAVGFVLLIACANVASLLLARGQHRQREIAVRAALGAGRRRLVRQLLTECLALSLLGLSAGLLLARWALPAILALSPADTPRIQQVSLSLPVLVFATLTALFTGLLFGLVPSLALTRGNVQEFLKEGGGSIGTSTWWRSALIAGEVALAVVLLVGAGLLVRSFAGLMQVDRGFASDRIVALEVYVWDRYATPDRRIAYFQDVAQELAALPGVQSAGAVSSMPFLTHGHAPSVAGIVEGQALPPEQAPTVYAIIATPGYFAAMGLPLMSGRLFTDADDPKGPRYAVVNTTMARLLWPGADPLGRRFSVPFRGGPVAFEVLGVVGDVRQSLDRPPRPEFYRPHTQNPSGSMTIVVRTAADPEPLVAAIKSRVWQVDRTQPFYNVAILENQVADSVSQRRFQVLLLGAFSGLALALAAFGIYGVLSFLTAQRGREIGLRMALGAQPRDILALVLRQGMKPVAAGLGLGLLAALALSRFLSGMLYGVPPTDPFTFAAIAALMALVALAACATPARRATRLDPLAALRYE